MKKTPKWTDTTQYSRGNRGRTPLEWTLATGSVRIVLHRHVHFKPDRWLLSCREIGMSCLLAEKDVDLAKNEALRIIFSECLDSIPLDALDA